MASDEVFETPSFTLPFTKIVDKKWSYIYAYNLKTIRDIFIYVAANEGIDEERLYQAMDEHIIPPPREEWLNPKVKRKDRLKLEYVHAARYLDLIERREDGFSANLGVFKTEKQALIKESMDHRFSPGVKSRMFTDLEIISLLPMILAYQRAKDFLWWFLDFKKYPTHDFGLEDFLSDARPIYILKGGKGKRTGDKIKREIDGLVWSIPNEENIDEEGNVRMDDYTRLVSFVLPNWFEELKIMVRIPIFKEIGEDRNSWTMCYPLKKNVRVSFLNLEKEILPSLMNSGIKNQYVIPIPLLIMEVARKYMISLEQIKELIIDLHKSNIARFVLERSSLQVMQHAKNLRDPRRDGSREMYIKYNGFYRSNMIVNKL